MLDVMSLCYDIYIQQDTMVLCRYKIPSGSLCPFTYLSALSYGIVRDDVPNNDIRPVPDAKQVMTNISRLQEQV
jgi:hypothetical protein